MIYDVRIEMLELFCVFDLKGARPHIESFLTNLPINLPESANTAATFGDKVLCDLIFFSIGRASPIKTYMRPPLICFNCVAEEP